MWLIIGYGNRLRGDDGAGPALADRLRTELPSGSALILVQHQLTPELVLELVKPEIQRVLFIDAKRLQNQTCKIKPLAKPYLDSGSCGHQFAPELLLQSAEKLYGQAKTGWLLTIPGVNFGFEEQLSDLTRAALEEAVPKCLRFLQKPQ